MSAILIPSSPTGLTGGEARVLERLVSCYAQTDGAFIYVQPRIRNLEPDFIIIDPSRGVAVVEVKDWTSERIGTLNRRTVTFTDGKEDQNPAFKTNRYFDLVKGVLEADQALYDSRGEFVPKLSARLIMSRLSNGGLAQLHEYLNLFPCVPLCSSAIAEMQVRDIFGDNACTLTAEQIAACRAALFPEIKIRRSVNDVVASVKALDAQQEQYAKRIPHGHAIVTGVPGSGKTVILLSRALYLAKDNPDWQILVVTYNRSLRSRLESRIHAIADELTFMGIPYQNIRITTFHALAVDLAGLVVPQNASQEFWDVTVAQAALAKAQPTYDAVLIDEYQDFCEDWFRVCVKLAKKHVFDGTETETLFLAGDRLQCIYNRSEFTWSNVGINVVGGQRSKLLKHTYRTGKTHITLALDYLMTQEHLRRDVEKFYEGREGIRNVSDVADEIGFLTGGVNAIAEHIRSLVNQAGIAPCDILVLAPRWDLAQAVCDGLPPNLRQNARVSKDVDEEVMMFTTYHSSKGLERKVVIMTDVDNVDDARRIYVGMTRASDRLYIHGWNGDAGAVFGVLQVLAKQGG